MRQFELPTVVDALAAREAAEATEWRQLNADGSSKDGNELLSTAVQVHAHHQPHHAHHHHLTNFGTLHRNH